MSSTDSQSTEQAVRSTQRETNSVTMKGRLRVIAPALLVIALLAVLVWRLNPPQPKFKPAPLQPFSAGCLKPPRYFLPSNITEIPEWRAGSSGRKAADAAGGAAFSTLPKTQAQRLLLRANMEPCSCGCKLSIAACRVNEPECEISAKLAQTILNSTRP